MSDFFTLRNQYYEEYRQDYGDGDYAMGLAEDAARSDMQKFAAEEEQAQRLAEDMSFLNEQDSLDLAVQTSTTTQSSGNLLAAGLVTLTVGAGALIGWLIDRPKRKRPYYEIVEERRRQREKERKRKRLQS